MSKPSGQKREHAQPRHVEDRAPYRLAWPVTIREAWVQASSFLAANGVDDASLHAEILLRHVLNIERAAYLVALTEPMEEDAVTFYEETVTRRAMGEPTQYIVGSTYFYGLPFKVTADVLIPRPETELLVEAVLAEAERLWSIDERLQVADIGTGSGAIACTLAHERPQWCISAGDISPGALAVAQHNAERLGVTNRMSWQQGDLLAPFVGRELDILVSNPPYIPANDIAGLMREVRDYEPRTALDGGADGLNSYRRLIAMLPQLGRVPRLIGFEVGQGQAGDVTALLKDAGYAEKLLIVPDLAGIERHVIGVKS